MILVPSVVSLLNQLLNSQIYIAINRICSAPSILTLKISCLDCQPVKDKNNKHNSTRGICSKVVGVNQFLFQREDSWGKWYSAELKC
uniref:Uncharacterized protein n=1 Tax=Utricularia reniformis TaxID=192314 RepID=A0A1Y0B1P5_9LAMI|nr:hypothetical protein AEK19_MT1097 [Utricularia reniformis]ART31317.1 hypothetical protein AEK19_MT1097 [Utricularia reniformis]